MDFNTEIRKKQLDNLDQLITSARSRVQSVLSYLDWNAADVLKETSLVQCPLNVHHKITPQCWTEHLEKCMIKLEGYDQNSQFFSESVDNPSQSIYIDHNKKIEIITKELMKEAPIRRAWNGLDPDPRTSERWMSTYSPDERLIFYNYCLENSSGPAAPPEFTTFVRSQDEEEKPLTYEQILQQQRDAKRRRAKYKSVHLNRKNHTEVMREVIENQMEEYKEWLQAQKPKNEECNKNGFSEEKKDDEERPHSAVSRNSNHSGSSRSTSRKYRRSRSFDRKIKREDRREASPYRHRDKRRKDLDWGRQRRRDREYSRDRRSRRNDRDRRH